MDTNKILDMNNMTISFPGCLALNDVNFSVQRGSVHALMGENGAGKSTLIKTLTGVYKADQGEIVFDGKKCAFQNPREAIEEGISTIYQETNLIPQLSIAENIFLGREFMQGKKIDWNRTILEAKRLMNAINIDVDVEDIISNKSTAIQQMVSIARAISVHAKLVVMDEPTSSLDDEEVEVLFGVVNELKERGASIIFITHKLDEVFRICDDMTILKDGIVVAKRKVAEISKFEMISLMVGRDASSIINGKKDNDSKFVRNEEIIRANNLIKQPQVINQSIQVKKGEIVGFAGLLGSGRTEFARAIYGADKLEKGEIHIKGEKVNVKNPRIAVKHKLAFCFEDRKIEGLISEMSVKDNLTLAILPKITKFGVISSKKQDEIVQKYINAFQIKISNTNQPIKSLSGGNQQKVLIARALAGNPELLFLDEPTRGIDVGAKKEILDITELLAKQGISIIMICSVIEELVSSCNRILVMRDGSTIGELCNSEISEDAILHSIAGTMVAQEV